MALRLIIVRHGLSTYNKDRRIQGRNDLSKLTKEGTTQAIKTGESLKDLPIDAIYSSSLQRAALTTKNLIGQLEKPLEPIFDEGLLEVDLEPWAGLTVQEVESQFPDQFKIWKSSPKDLVLTHKDGKKYNPIQELMAQSNDFIEKLILRHSPQDNQTVLIVGHNAILRCLILQLIGEPNQGFRKFQVNNASISIFNLNPTEKNKRFKTQIECLNSTTHLDPIIPRKGKNARVILVRHGETDWNLEGRFQGQIDIPLNKNGQKQARAAGKFLKGVAINKAYTSPMSRPKETAEAILASHQGVEITKIQDLMEIGHGLWEGKLESEIKENWPDLLETWKKSPQKVQMPQGETIKEVWERSTKAWKEICSSLTSNETALVVAHDAVNKTILCNLLGLSPSDIWMIKQGNGGVTVVDISPDPSQPDVVTCLNLTSHLGGVLDNTATGAL